MLFVYDAPRTSVAQFLLEEAHIHFVCLGLVVVVIATINNNILLLLHSKQPQRCYY